MTRERRLAEAIRALIDRPNQIATMLIESIADEILAEPEPKPSETVAEMRSRADAAEKRGMSGDALQFDGWADALESAERRAVEAEVAVEELQNCKRLYEYSAKRIDELEAQLRAES